MKHKNSSRNEKLEYEVGSENVFADLGFENPEEELLKANLTVEIAKIIKKKHLTQAHLSVYTPSAATRSIVPLVAKTHRS